MPISGQCFTSSHESNRTKINQIIILGAGISGLSAAWKFSENNYKVEIIEAHSDIGGLAGTFKQGPYRLDYGPHSFHTENKEILGAVLGLFDHQLKPRPRVSKFYYNGKLLDYPITAQNVLLNMGLRSGFMAVMSYLNGKFVNGRRFIYKKELTVEEWAKSNYGEYLYKTFFKPYTEQFWKIPCHELSIQSIPAHTRLSFSRTLRALFLNKVLSLKGSVVDRELLPTYYPETGYGEISGRIYKHIKENVNLHLNSHVVSVSQCANGRMRVLYQCLGEIRSAEGDYVVSTMPITNLISTITPSPPQAILDASHHLGFRALIILGMITRKQNVLKCQYLYMLHRPYNRIYEMNMFSPKTSPEQENIVAVEIPCKVDSQIWQSSKEEIFNMCIGSLKKDGILSFEEVTDTMLLKAPHAYPIYYKNYDRYLSTIKDYLKGFKSLAILGRSGEYLYMDIDKCMARAFNLVDTFCAHKQSFSEIT